jgi:hypothetical protein
MADYYPLISRAVAALEKNSGDNRRALYERARAALLAQLRSVSPALNESDITRERLALEESIRKVEAESARRFVEPSRQPPPRIRPAEPRSAEPPRPAEPRSSEPLPWSEEGPSAPPPRRYVDPPPAGREGRPDAARQPLEPRRFDPTLEQPPPAESPAPAAQRHPLRRSTTERRSLSDAGLKDFRHVASGEPGEGGAAARAERSGRESSYAASPASDLERSQPRMFEPHAPQERMFEPRKEQSAHPDFSEPMLESSSAVDESRRAPAKGRRSPPPPVEDELEYADHEPDVRPRRSYAPLLKGLAAAAAVVCVGGLLAWQWPRMVEAYRSLRAPTEMARDAAVQPATPKKVQERVEPGSQQAATTPGSQPAAAVAQKVVLYEEDPGDPNGKRFVGSAIWRTETVTAGPGQQPELAIRADVEVPERKLAMTWLLRRNTDKGLPATHTVEIMFRLPADFPSGGITNVPGILMKQAEQTRGVPLAGSAVKVTNGFYLIGLSNLDTDKERNVQLLKERAWFDIPVVYNNNRRAILAMEKGTPGERVFADAFKAWKQ